MQSVRLKTDKALMFMIPHTLTLRISLKYIWVSQMILVDILIIGLIYTRVISL